MTIESALEKLRARERDARLERERLQLAAKHPAIAALDVAQVVTSGRRLILVCKVPDRAAVAVLFATLEPFALPVVTYRGTFAGVKPAADYTAADGTVELDAQYALPCAYDVQGSGDSYVSEKLKLDIETETDRISVWIEPEKPAARFTKEAERDGRGRLLRYVYNWEGLPNANTVFRYAAGGGPGNFGFAFDTSTDLAAWLTPRPREL